MRHGTESTIVFAKICVLVISVGVVACVLLGVRQQRLDAVGEMTRTQLRMMELDRDINVLRTEIATNILPEHVEQLAGKFGELRSIELRVPGPVRVPATTVVHAEDRGRSGSAHEAYGQGVRRNR